MDGENNEQAAMAEQQQEEQVPAQDMDMEGTGEGNVPEEAAAIEGMDDMEGQVEGGDMGMDGAIEEGGDLQGMDEGEAAVEETVDCTRDTRIQWMCKFVEDLVNFDATAPTCSLNNDRLQPYYNFLERADYTRFFVWCDFETGELTYSYERAPQFYESGKQTL